jgi:hypothetical protein
MRNTLLLTVLLMALTASAQSVDSLRMDSIMHQLPDVIVKGERPIAKVKGSTIIYDLPRLIEKKSVDNIYDAVKELPGVIEQNEKITLGGIPTTVILDGKVTTMTSTEITSLLRSLPANSIAKAEVMYNAPAKMQLRGAVINIILKHHTDGGAPLQGEVNLALNQKHDTEFEERASLLYNKGKLSVDMMYVHSHGKDYSWTDETSHHSLDDGSVHDIISNEIACSSDHGDKFRLGMDYRFADNNTLSFLYNGVYNHGQNLQDMSGSIIGQTDIMGHDWLHNFRLDYNAPFGLKAGAEMTYYHNPENQFLNSTLPTGKLNYSVDNNQKVNRWKFFLSQEHNLGKEWNLNYGITYTTSINNCSQYYVDATSTTSEKPSNSYTHQSENDVNLYVGFDKSFGKKLTTEASVAAEYYHSPNWHHWDFFPTFNITYMPQTGHMLQVGLSYDRTYPEYWAMTNFTTYSNGGYNEITGNPNLKPTDEYQFQTVYVIHSKYQFIGWFNYVNNYFVQSPYQRHDRLAISYQSQNFNFQQQAGLQAIVPFKVSQWLDSRVTLTGIWLREKDDHFYDISFDRHIFFGIANINNNITLSTSPDITLSIDGMIRSKAIQATYNLPASGDVNFSTRWLFLKKHAIIRIFCNDIFQTAVINPRVNYNRQNLSMDFSCYRELGISFTYKFGGYKEKTHQGIDTSRFKQ